MTVETLRGQRVLTEVAPEAEGLSPGQTLAQARALYPGLIALEADPDGDRAALTALAAWAERYTPLVAADIGDDPNTDNQGLWLDISGCAHLFGGEAALLDDLRARLLRHGIPARMALAGTTGAAWALARTPGHAHTSTHGAIIASGAEPAALALLPIAALRLETRAIAGLRRLGVREVANLARLPREDVTARFGPQPVLRLDQAFGRAAEAITWPRPSVPFHAMQAFVEPIGTADDFSRALSLLTQTLCMQLTEAGEGGLRFAARFFRVDNTTQEITIATARPVRDVAYVAKLLGMKLETVDPGFGVETISLTAEDTALLSAVQAEAFAVADELDGLAAVVDRISNDIGPENIWRPAPFPSHVPEHAVTRMPVIQKAPLWQHDPTQPRPIRLLRRPEAIEVTAPVPDDPPILFRWRRRVHRVRAATGPERIAAEWWRERQRSASDQNQERQRSASDQNQERQRSANDQNQEHQGDRAETDLLRDYYQVEDADGARFWVFRAGLHGDGHTPRWFLHGLFG